MNRSTTTIFVALLAILLSLPIYTAPAADPEEIQRLEERLSALEQETAALRTDIEAIKSQTNMEYSYEKEPSINTAVLGTWECTNNIFNYEISLMQNGIVITKEMSSGSTRQGKWVRRGKDDIVITNPGYRSSGMAQSFRVKDISDDRMSLEEPNTQSIYDCNKLSQE